MRKITVLSIISLDGVMQAPGGPEEDPSGGFKYGGWAVPFGDDAYDQAVLEELNQQVDYLLGRKTFDIWEAYWPDKTFWPGINEGTKYVLSGTRKKSDWQNSRFIESLEDIRKLKDSAGLDIHVWGSSELVKFLLEHDLVDELRLKIHPLLLGNGENLFDKAIMSAAFTLLDQRVTTTGVILANYKRAGDIETGTAGE